MRAHELTTITEADFAPGIKDTLIQQGYKFLGQGVDQQAYLAPDGTVLKIFGTRGVSRGSMQLTRAQEAFKLFADFCRANSNNPFLPEFSDWNMFHYDERPYLQIKTERLFEFQDKFKIWAEVLEEIADRAVRSKDQDTKDFWLRTRVIDPIGDGLFSEARIVAAQELVLHMGAQEFNQLWDTIYNLSQLARQNGIIMDLHDGNFMLGSDGHIVINDPFFTGSGS
jgi:hypothetical protein